MLPTSFITRYVRSTIHCGSVDLWRELPLVHYLPFKRAHQGVAAGLSTVLQNYGTAGQIRIPVLMNQNIDGLIQQTFNSLSSDTDFYGTHDTTSCAIVDSNADIEGMGFGNDIDRHSAVFRFGKVRPPVWCMDCVIYCCLCLLRIATDPRVYMVLAWRGNSHLLLRTSCHSMTRARRPLSAP